MARKLRSAVLGEALEEGVRHFHMISRTVRKEWLISEADMRQQACDVLKRLTRAYAIDMCSFTVMSNHFHTVIEWNPQQAQSWSAAEVVERWEIAHPIRSQASRQDSADTYRQNVRQNWLNNPEWIEAHRQMLSSISFFMKDFKQYLGQAINHRLDSQGAVWAGRFKMIPLRTQSEIVSTMAYVDLNPHAANMCDKPEDDNCTSLHERARQARAISKQGAKKYSRSTSSSAQRTWLKPLGNECGQGKPLLCKHSEALPWYLKLVDATARLLREGKRQMDDATRSILNRLELVLQTDLNSEGFMVQLVRCAQCE